MISLATSFKRLAQPSILTLRGQLLRRRLRRVVLLVATHD